MFYVTKYTFIYPHIPNPLVFLYSSVSLRTLRAQALSSVHAQQSFINSIITIHSPVFLLNLWHVLHLLGSMFFLFCLYSATLFFSHFLHNVLKYFPVL